MNSKKKKKNEKEMTENGTKWIRIRRKFPARCEG